MNRLCTVLENRECRPGKHSLPRGENPIRNNGADVAELVDARDLKSPGATEIAHLSDLTRAGNPHEAGGDPAVLSNTPPPLSAGWQALENVGRRLLTDIDKEVPCAAGFINDVVVVVEDGDREFVAAQISLAKASAVAPSQIHNGRLRQGVREVPQSNFRSLPPIHSQISPILRIAKRSDHR